MLGSGQDLRYNLSSTHKEQPKSVIQEDPNHKNLFLITSDPEDLIPPKLLWLPTIKRLMGKFYKMFVLVIYVFLS